MFFSFSLPGSFPAFPVSDHSSLIMADIGPADWTWHQFPRLLYMRPAIHQRRGDGRKEKKLLGKILRGELILFMFSIIEISYFAMFEFAPKCLLPLVLLAASTIVGPADNTTAQLSIISWVCQRYCKKVNLEQIVISRFFDFGICLTNLIKSQSSRLPFHSTTFTSPLQLHCTVRFRAQHKTSRRPQQNTPI